MSEVLTVALTRARREQAAHRADDPRPDDRRRLRDRADRGRYRLLGSAVQAQIDSLGANTLTVTRRANPRRPVRRWLELQPDARRRGRARQPLRGARREERRAGRERLSATLTYGSSTYEPSTFVGTTPSYEQARDYSIAEGKWFTKAAGEGPRPRARDRPDGRPGAVRRRRPGRRQRRRSTTRASRSSASPRPRARTARPTSTTSRPRRSPRCRSCSPATAASTRSSCEAKARDALNAAQTEVTDILNQVDPPSARSG